MGNNSSSGSAIRGSRDKLNEVADGEAKGSSQRKKSVDDAKGGRISNNRSAAQPPGDDETAYDMPYEQPNKEDVAASPSSGHKRGSAPATVTSATAAALAAEAAAAAASGQRKRSDAGQSGGGLEEATAVDHKRKIFGMSKKKKSISSRNADASHGGSATVDGDAAVGDNAVAELAAVPPVTNTTGSKVKQPTRSDLARLGSKEEASSSSAPAPKSGTTSATRARVLPSPLTPPPRIPVTRNASAEDSAAPATTVPGPSITSGGIGIDDDDDGKDTYDRIQRDVRPSKVKAAAARQQGAGDGSNATAPGSPYDDVYTVPSSQQQPSSVVPLAAVAASAPAKTVGLQQIGRPQLLMQAREHSDEDGESCYDVIQRDVNAAKAKQKSLQQQQQQQRLSGTPTASASDREGCSRLVGSNRDDDSDGADAYDVIQRDVNPLKVKQQLQQAQSSDGRVADSEGRTKLGRGSASAAVSYVDYSLPLTSAPSVDSPALDGSGTAARETVPVAAATDRTGAAAPRIPRQRSEDGVEPYSASPTAADDGGGEYECIRENFVIDTARPSTNGERVPRSTGSDCHVVGCSAPGDAGSTSSTRLRMNLTSTASGTAAVSTFASAASTVSHDDGGWAKATSPAKSAAAAARPLYSEVIPVANRLAATPSATSPPGGSDAPATSAGRLPAKRFAASVEDNASCEADLSRTDASLPAWETSFASSVHHQEPATDAPEASVDQRKLRTNATTHRYENVGVFPPVPQRREGSRDAPTNADSEDSFESSSAFYANDQSLRGSPQPPALTASPPLPRSGGRSRDAEVHRPKPLATAKGTAGLPEQQLSPLPPSPTKPQPKAKPVNSKALYAEIDLAVGTPVGHVVEQQHPAQHTHSTQDGLLTYPSTPTVGPSSPPTSLSPPRQRPWVRQVQPRYEDIDDVRNGAA